MIGFVVQFTHDVQGSLERHALANASRQAAMQDSGAGMIRGLQLLVMARRAADRSVRATDQMGDAQDVSLARSTHRPSRPSACDRRLLDGVDRAALNALFEPIGECSSRTHPL